MKYLKNISWHWVKSQERFRDYVYVGLAGLLSTLTEGLKGP